MVASLLKILLILILAQRFPSYSIDLSDVFLFQPDLRSNEYLAALSKRNLKGSLRVIKSMANFQYPKSGNQWGMKPLSWLQEGYVMRQIPTIYMSIFLPLKCAQPEQT
jgi:hypothetical protein